MTQEDPVFAKCAWRLIPFLVLLFTVNFLDRVNVGFAALTMNRDLGFSPATYGFAAGVFFLGYFAFEVPSNVALARMGARVWFAWIMASWGVLSAMTALTWSAGSFHVLRFALGAAEAGFFPGVIYYLTLWFPQSHRARFVAAFISAAPLAGVIGGPLSGLVLGMDGVGGLHGWQWLFVIEGLPAIVLAIAVLTWLPNGPANARWLTAQERSVIARHLSSSNDAPKERALWPALRDPRLLVLSLALMGIQSGLFGISLWLPQIVQAMGFTNLQTGLIVAPPYLLSMAAMIWWGRASDRKAERIWHVAIPALAAAAGLFAAAFLHAPLAVLLALTVAVIGIEATLGPFWGLPSAFLGDMGAAGGIALANAIGSLGGFLAPFAIGILRQRSGDYSGGMIAMAVGLLMTAILVLAIGRALPRTIPAAVLQEP